MMRMPKELLGSGQLLGYQSMWRRINQKYKELVARYVYTYTSVYMYVMPRL